MTDLRRRLPPATDILHATARGAIAAMAMSGLRALTTELGIVDQTPPEAIITQRAHGALRLVPEGGRRGALELAHWTYGAGGGALFAVLPERIRRIAWAGPAYGLVLWLGFELGIAPVLGLRQAGRARPAERIAFAVDHALYGLVLSEIRRRPQR